MSKINIFLLDNQVLFRQGLRALMEREPNVQVVGESLYAPTLFESLKSATPDIVILEPEVTQTSDLGGVCHKDIDIFGAIQELLPHAALLVLSSAQSRPMISAAIRAGVPGFLRKNCSVHDLRRALNSLAGGKRFYDAGLTDIIRSSRIHGKGRDLYCSPIPPRLTSREREILQYLAAGFSAPTIADLLSISRHTVANHRCALMQKLQCRSSTALVAKAVARGLVHARDELA